MKDNKVLLTLYIFPGDDKSFDNVQRIMDSIDRINCDVVFLDHRNEFESCDIPDTKWWGYLFGNEWFDSDIAEVLDVYLKSEYDVITFFKDVIKPNGDKGVFLASRVFKTSKVPLGVETYKKVEGLSFVKALDGWIREEGKNECNGVSCRTK